MSGKAGAVRTARWGVTSNAPPGHESGFSLIELLVAISVFAVVLVGFAGVFVSAAGSIADQRTRAAATRIASDHLETLRALPADLLDAEVRETTVNAPGGRTFTIVTDIEPIDAATGERALGGNVRQVTATVRWTAGGRTRSVSHVTAITPTQSSPPLARAIGTVTMFPNPATVDAGGVPLHDIDVTVPLQGFDSTSLVHLSWTNDDGSDRSQTLTSSSGLNWRGVIPRTSIRAGLSPNGSGAVTFNVTAGDVAALYTLAVQVSAASPPAITAASIDPNPITVTKPTGNRTCASMNQCQNTTDLTFTVSASNLDPTQDRVIVQFQLYDGSAQELPLVPTGGSWVLTVRQKTTKFLAGTDRRFGFTVTRSADGATASTTVLRTVVVV